MNMRLAICNETFREWESERAFATARQLGYEGIEFAPFTLGADASAISRPQRELVRRQLASAGLDAVGLHWLLAGTDGYYLTSPEVAVRRRTSAYLGQLAELCRDLGGNIMVLGSPAQRNLLPGIAHDQAVDFAADVLRKAVPTLEAYQVTLAVEPLGPQEGNFLNTTAAGIDLVQRVNNPQVQLHLDVKAMCSEGQPLSELIRQGAPYLAHFHVNDPNLRGPGMGEVDFMPILQALHDVGYERWLSVEVFDYEPGVEALASESIRTLRQCLGQIAARQ